MTAHGVRPDADWVLYWMVAFRRTRSNFALERAVDWAVELGKPLLIVEPLRLGYRWASDRLHRFVIDGMADNARAVAGRPGVTYLPWIETEPDAGKGLLSALASRASVVVTDDFPAFFIPRLLAAAASQVSTRLEAVDANGLLPVRQSGQAFSTAYAFRRYVQRTFIDTFPQAPLENPLEGMPAQPQVALAPSLVRPWFPNAATAFIEDASKVSQLPIDHSIAPVAVRGGARAAADALKSFLLRKLTRYLEKKAQLDDDSGSQLSPYLHFGHISSWDVFHGVMAHEGWLGTLPRHASGVREGWWGIGAEAEAFLDQLVTWRELGFNTCVEFSEGYDRFDTLPSWARATLDRHRDDPRGTVYDFEAFERAATHDALWNAAQGQLIADGRIHNYVRMLWGKKILEWSATPEVALEIMIELNNKYAVDGRDPNSYSGIFWTLGRYDRPWAPERPIFGTVRYMSSENTARKMRVAGYIRRYSPAPR